MKILARLPRLQLAIYAFYLAVALLITWPLATALSSQLVGDSTSDAYEMARHIWWFKYALQTGQPLFFQPLLGYPNGMTGVSLWADPLQFFPAWLFAFAMPLASAYNLTILLTMALNGWAMYRLTAYLLGKFDAPARTQQAASLQPSPVKTGQFSAPALLAGLVFMAFPTMQGHLLGGHAGLLVMWPVPLYVYALSRLLETPRRRWLILSVLFFVLSPTGHALQAIYVLMPITGLSTLTLMLRRQWAKLSRVILVSLVGGAFLLIFLLPVVGETVQTSAYTAESSTVVRYSVDLLGIVSPSFQHPFFGRLEYPRRVLGVNLVEGSTYPGIAVTILAVIAVWRRRDSRWWLALAVLAWILSLGPLLKVFDTPVSISSGPYETYITLPFAALQNLPFFDLARTPGRFTFVLALALAALAGWGASVVWNAASRIKGRYTVSAKWVLAFLLMAVVLWEYQFFWPVPTVPAAIPEAVAALSERDDVRAVFDIPWGHLLAAKDALYLQTAHHKPLIAGHVTRQTPVSPAKLSILESTLDPALLNDAGADIVILHKSRAAEINRLDALTALAHEQLGAPFYQDDRIALFSVPETDAVPAFTMLPAPQTDIARYAESYFYVPDTGWIDAVLTLEADARDVELYLDGKQIHRWMVSGQMVDRVPFVVASGYHTVTAAIQPPCPEIYNPALDCKTVKIHALAFDYISKPAIDFNVVKGRYERGVSLLDWTLPESAHTGSELPVWLNWSFDAADGRSATDVRFVHVLDAGGVLVAQQDSPLSGFVEEGRWAEEVLVELPGDLQPGTYQVYTGWYTYPEMQRFCVMRDDKECISDTLLLGAVIVTNAP